MLACKKAAEFFVELHADAACVSRHELLNAIDRLLLNHFSSAIDEDIRKEFYLVKSLLFDGSDRQTIRIALTSALRLVLLMGLDDFDAIDLDYYRQCADRFDKADVAGQTANGNPLPGWQDPVTRRFVKELDGWVTF